MTPMNEAAKSAPSLPVLPPVPMMSREAFAAAIGLPVGVTEEKPALPPTRKSRSAGTQVNVLLTSEEHQLLTAAARGEGLRRTEWIVKLIRATLLRQPQFNRTEVDALAESSRQLAAIGRNLNQIARTLNMDPNASRSVTVERVETLSAEIKRHCALVAELTEASISRRSAKP